MGLAVFDLCAEQLKVPDCRVRPTVTIFASSSLGCVSLFGAQGPAFRIGDLFEAPAHINARFSHGCPEHFVWPAWDESSGAWSLLSFLRSTFRAGRMARNACIAGKRACPLHRRAVLSLVFCSGAQQCPLGRDANVPDRAQSSQHPLGPDARVNPSLRLSLPLAESPWWAGTDVQGPSSEPRKISFGGYRPNQTLNPKP